MARQQGTTPQRGYGYRHQQLREQYRPQVDAGQAYCQQPVCVMVSRWIPPGSAWDLGHNDARDGWIGPCHAKCNRIAGNRSPRRRRRRIIRRGRPLITSRRW